MSLGLDVHAEEFRIKSAIWSPHGLIEVLYREVNVDFGGHIFSFTLIQLAGTVASSAAVERSAGGPRWA
jgi:hypothetical protein